MKMIMIKTSVINITVILSMIFVGPIKINGPFNQDSNIDNDTTTIDTAILIQDSKKLSMKTLEMQNWFNVDGKTKKVKSKIRLLVPNEFVLMNRDQIALKYPRGNRPSNVYSSKNGDINIAVKISKEILNGNNFENVANQIYQNISSLDVGNFSSEKIRLGNREGQKFEFISDAKDGKIHNIMVLTYVSNHMTLISLNCMQKDYKNWEHSFNKIVKSIELTNQ